MTRKNDVDNGGDDELPCWFFIIFFFTIFHKKLHTETMYNSSSDNDNSDAQSWTLNSGGAAIRLHIIMTYVYIQKRPIIRYGHFLQKKLICVSIKKEQSRGFVAHPTYIHKIGFYTLHI